MSLSIIKRPDIQLKKAVEAIAIRPTSGRITMLVRKSFNVILHNAIEQGVDVEVYRMRLADLIANVSPDSNDYETFKTYLRKMNATQVEWNSSPEDGIESWGVSSLLAEAEVVHNKREGYVLEYSFAPKIKKRLLNPNTYAHINLKFQTVLKSNASLALYEICSRYSGNPSHVTMRATWQWWRPVLTGTPDNESEDECGEYKYFKRDVLKPSISEVNRLTDIDIMLVEHKIGRRIDEIQFRIQNKTKSSLDLGTGPLIDSQLLQKIVDIGFKPAAAREVYTENEESLVKTCTEKTEARIKNKSLSSLASPVAYFKSLLKDKNNTSLSAKKQAVVIVDPVSRIREAYLAQQKKDAREMFNEANASDRSRWTDSFETEYLTENPQILKAYTKNNLESKLVQTAFVSWLSNHIWGSSPSDTELLTYAASKTG